MYQHYDSLSESEKKEWQEYLAQQQINEQLRSSRDRKTLGYKCSHGTKGYTWKWKLTKDAS